MAVDHVSEGERMRRVPGIVFADGPLGRRARIAGTGLDVFELIKAYLAFGRDRMELRDVFDWLEPAQLQAALDYYAAYPEEIDARLAVERSLTPPEHRVSASAADS